ncbi:hypothetical protein [Nocardia terpenica]|uniref:hypothetical protein n=1 Tax=Nocardia terpenica TaxID=455432 RepID=UPI00142D50A2|nr:hypothetical protein [Nocardia terpenica]
MSSSMSQPQVFGARWISCASYPLPGRSLRVKAAFLRGFRGNILVRERKMLDPAFRDAMTGLDSACGF